MFCIGEVDLRIVHIEVITIVARWYELGIQLGIHPGIVEAVRRNYRDFGDGLYQVLLLWLRRSNIVEQSSLPSWRVLVQAVASPTGGHNHALAVDIANRHLGEGYLSVHFKIGNNTIIILRFSDL